MSKANVKGPTRFIDANVFVYAFFKGKRELKKKDRLIKNAAKNIISRVSRGEETIITVVQLSEVANFLEDWLSLNEALTLIEGILLRDNIKIESVDRLTYISALDSARENRIGLNDAIALLAMQKNQISEIYSFDKHFDKIEGVHRIAQ